MGTHQKPQSEHMISEGYFEYDVLNTDLSIQV